MDSDPTWSPPIRRRRLNQSEEESEEEENDQSLLLMSVEIEEVIPLEDSQQFEQAQFAQIATIETINVEVGEASVESISSLAPYPMDEQTVRNLQAVAGPSSQPDPSPSSYPPLTGASVLSAQQQQQQLEHDYCLTSKF